LDLARKGMTSASMKGTLEVVAVASKFDHYDKSKTGIPCACCLRTSSGATERGRDAVRHGADDQGDRGVYHL
jgi:hypothetical protein